jgi:hypothetical protein
MKDRIIVFLFVACAIVVVTTPRPAEARAVIPELRDVTTVLVTPRYEQVDSVSELCGLYLYFRQLIAVPGVGMMWVLTDSIYPTGPKDVVLDGECDDGGTQYGVYEFYSSCPCNYLRERVGTNNTADSTAQLGLRSRSEGLRDGARLPAGGRRHPALPFPRRAARRWIASSLR